MAAAARAADFPAAWVAAAAATAAAGPPTGAAGTAADVDDSAFADALLLQLLARLHGASDPASRASEIEALLLVPRLCDAYPFPTIINAALLKVADVFLAGPNEKRIYALRVLQETERHVPEVLNKDEFLRRLTTVLLSNDPVARAITLRALAAIAPILVDRADVHHRVRLALEVTHGHELEAAIEALRRICRRSPRLAQMVFERLCAKVDHLETPLDTRARLIAVFGTMGHDPDLAAKAYRFGRQQLVDVPLIELVLPWIASLTALAVAIPAVQSDHAMLLLDLIAKEPRVPVRTAALRALPHLLQRSPVLDNGGVEACLRWQENSAQRLLRVAATAIDRSECILACHAVATQLAHRSAPPCIVGRDGGCGDAAADLLTRCAASLEVAAPSAPLVQAVSKLVLAALRPNVTLAGAASKDALVGTCLAVWVTRATAVAKGTEADVVPLKAWLTAVGRAAVALPETAPDVVADLLDAMAAHAAPAAVAMVGRCVVLVCRMLPLDHPGPWAPLIQRCERLLERAPEQDATATRAIAMVALALERRQVLARGVAGDAMATTLSVATLQRAVAPWPILALDVGQSALAAGLPTVAAAVFQPLQACQLSGSSHHALAVLAKVAAAMAAATAEDLSQPARDRLEMALAALDDASTACELVAASHGPRPFQQDWLDVMSEYLGLLRRADMQLRQAEARPELPLSTFQVRALATAMRTLTHKVAFLRSSTFGMDDDSAALLDGWAAACDLLAHLLTRAAADMAPSAPMDVADVPSARLWALRHGPAVRTVLAWRCRQVLLQADALPTVAPEDVRTAISLLLEAGAAVPPALLRAPRSLQAAVTVPAGWRNGAAVRVTHGGHVTVHVEGVLHHDALDDATDPEAIRQARHALRSVAAVHVRVALVPAAASPVAHQQLLGSARPRLAERVALTYMTSGAAGPPDPILQSAARTVPPHDDYFRATFVLATDRVAASAVPAQLAVLVHVALEEAGSGWVCHTGPDLALPLQVDAAPVSTAPAEGAVVVG